MEQDQFMTPGSMPLLNPASRIDRATAVGVAAFVAWFIKGLETTTTYLFFQYDPKWGTGANIIGTCVTLYFVVLVALAFGYHEKKHVWSRPTMWIMLYAFLAGLSLLWTESPKFNALGYWVGFVVELTVVALLLRCARAEDVAIPMMKGFVWSSILLAMVAWTAPGTWELRLGQQEYLHPNIIGNQFALAALFSIHLGRRYQNSSQWQWITLGLAFSLLRSLSKASIISFFVAAGFYLVRHSKLAVRTQLKIAFVTALMFAVSWTFIEPYIEMYSEGQNIETVTGRTVIWAVSFSIAAEKTWLGHGIVSYITVVPNFGEFVARHAHNDFLQQFFSLGLVGLFLSIAVYLSFYRHIRRSPRTPERGLALTLLIYGLLHGLTDASPVELMLPCSVILLFSEWLQEDSFRVAERASTL